jgi:hypothetical protein
MDLPPPAELERITRGLATLDAILCEDWEMRYYSFDRTWGQAERLASMRDGEGDEWFLLFTKAGAFLKGLAHEHPPGKVEAIYKGLPAKLRGWLDEPAFTMEDTSYGGWYDKAWVIRGAPKLKKVMAEHLGVLGGDPKRYKAHAKAYFEVDVPLDAIAHVLAGKPLDQALVKRIGGERTLRAMKKDLAEIGYGQ